MRIDVPPRRGPGCACSSRASKRARPCAWSCGAASRVEMSRGGVCDVRGVEGAAAARTLRFEERGKGRQRGTETRVEKQIRSLAVSRRRRGQPWLVGATAAGHAAVGLASPSRGGQIGRGESAWPDLRAVADDNAGGRVEPRRPARWVFSRKLLSSVDMSLRLSRHFPCSRGASRGGGRSSRLFLVPNRTRVRVSSRQGA